MTPEQLDIAHTLAYRNGDWVTRADLGWELSDVGPTVAAIAVERLRSFGGAALAIDLHYERLQRSTSWLRIKDLPQRDAFTGLIDDLLRRNATFMLKHEDASIVVLMSPGLMDRGETSHSTLMIYLDALPIKRLATYYRDGVSVAVSKTQNIAASVVPTSVKLRNRVQYFVADLEVQEIDPHAVAVLPTADGSLSDTSFATLWLVRDGKLFLPPPDACLHGITATRAAAVVSRHYSLQVSPLTTALAKTADELLLLGSTGQVHAVSSINWELHNAGVQRLPGVTGSAYQIVLEELRQAANFDFVAQALRLSDRKDESV